MSQLKNKIVFITGATSGIGLACAEAFAAEGANLILAARRVEKLEEVKNALVKKFGIKVLAKDLDVRRQKDVESFIASLPSEWSAINVLVNNAGLARGLSNINEGSLDDWEEMIDTNVKGLLYVTREVSNLMIKNGAGHIINIGSIAGHEVYPKGNVYCATKFAVNALTKGFRADLLNHKIKVTTIDPGMVETEFSVVRFRGDEEKAKKVYEGLTPLSGADIAETAVWCASRPKHVNINEIIIMPAAQASSTLKHIE